MIIMTKNRYKDYEDYQYEPHDERYGDTFKPVDKSRSQKPIQEEDDWDDYDDQN